MKIDVLVDVYPHSSKPYFDTQFVEWQQAGHDVRVFSLSALPGASAPLSVRVLRTLRDRPWLVLSALLKCVTRPRRSLRVIKSARSLVEAVKLLCLDAQLPSDPPALFFVHNLTAAARFAYLKHAIPNARVAVYYHGGEIAGCKQISPDEARRAFESTDIVFSNTDYSIEDAIARGAPRERICKVPVGFKLSDFPDVPTRFYGSEGKLHLVSVGRLSAEKGFDVALRALAELRKIRDDFDYTIIGDGPERGRLEALTAELGLGSVVRFAGQVTARALPGRLLAADILLVSSVPFGTWKENQACVMQEAMLMRVPVVASQTGGVAESLPAEMGEFLFEPGHHNAMALSIHRMMNANLAALGAIGRRFVEDRYDIEQINARLLALAFEPPSAIAVAVEERVAETRRQTCDEAV